MKWLHHFSTLKIPFHLYKLGNNDSIICSSNINKDKSFIVIHGIVYLLKIFTNKEMLTLGIFTKGDIISNIEDSTYSYYNIIAMKETFLMSFILDDAIYYNKTTNHFFGKMITSLKSTLKQYEKMNIILAHKCTRNRVIQLILFLAKEYGLPNIYNNEIRIPFYISQVTISTIVGSNKNNVNNIMNKLLQTNTLRYSSQKHLYIKNPFILSYIK